MYNCIVIYNNTGGYLILSNTQQIVKDLKNNIDIFEITDKYYNLAKSEIFKEELDLEYEIKNKISKNFSIPLSSIKIVGSGHIGSSPFKERDFEKGKSDLDIGIVDERLFNFFLHKVIIATNNYTDLTFFNNKTRDNKSPQYFRYRVSRGILDFSYLKNINEIDSFEDFFRKLSNVYFTWFKDINARIYLSETCLVLKQLDNIEKLKEVHKI